MNVWVLLAIGVGYAVLLYFIWKSGKKDVSAYIKIGSEAVGLGKAIADVIIEDEHSQLRKWLGYADIAVRGLKEDYQKLKEEGLVDDALRDDIAKKAMEAVKVLAKADGVELSDADEKLIEIAVGFVMRGIDLASETWFRESSQAT